MAAKSNQSAEQTSAATKSLPYSWLGLARFAARKVYDKREYEGWDFCDDGYNERFRIWSDSQIEAEGRQDNPPTSIRRYYYLRINQHNYWKWLVMVNDLQASNLDTKSRKAEAQS